MTENRLADETSPYLLQHKDNPVHWRPWGAAALEEARQLNRPILLSIGYAACHWCHVMAHESFEDPATAAVMNRLFVNIKVDREERPDLDRIYQHALALLGEHGGWPLTMFCTPKGEPFWGGTYFPPEPRYGRPAFRDLLRRVAEIYHQEQDTVRHNVGTLRQGLAGLTVGEPGGPLGRTAVVEAAERLLAQVDMVRGGLGPAPKFPQVPLFKLLWRAWKATGRAPFRDAVLATLRHMCQGGIYDHLGGGFARYATDAAWLVPHFEKMLYDNAQLLDLLADAWLETRDPLFDSRARETVAWVLRDMTVPEGAFASSQDADSDGEEGRFYLWSDAEIDALLGADAALFKPAYGITPAGNWEGKNILNRSADPGSLDPALEPTLARCRAVLFAARERRVKPGRDDKVLADWNGLMIAALARAALAFDEPSWLASAERAFRFVRDRMAAAGRLAHSYRAGKTAHVACLDDYAALIDGALALHEATSQHAYLSQAEQWVETAVRHYWDAEGGGFFFTAEDVTDVITRTKSAHDNATPSGNGMLATALVRLFHLTGAPAHRERAERTLRAFSGQLERHSLSLATLLAAADFLDHAMQIVLVGTPGDAAFQALRRAALESSQPNRILQLVAPGESLPSDHPAAGKTADRGRPTAYLCAGMRCSLPITAPDSLRAALSPRRGHA